MMDIFLGVVMQLLTGCSATSGHIHIRGLTVIHDERFI